jgi:hypothetical protein
VVFSFDCYSFVPFCFVNLVDLDVEGVYLLLVRGLFVLVATVLVYAVFCSLIVGDVFFFTIVFRCSGGLRYVRRCCPILLY